VKDSLTKRNNYMAQPTKNTLAKPPDESGLRLLLDNNLIDEAQSLIDIHNLQYKIICRDGKYMLEDSVVGAELWLKKFITDDPSLFR